MNVLAQQRVQEEALGPLRRARADGYDLHLHRDHPAWIPALESEFEMRRSSMWEDGSADPFGVIAGFGTRWPHLGFRRHNRDPLEHDPYVGRTSSNVAR